MNRYIQILMLLFLATCAQAVFAQSLAIKGGFTSSNLRYDESQDDENTERTRRNGFHLGAAVDIPIYKFLSIEPGVFYATRGASVGVKTTLPGQNIAANFRLVSSYLSVPLNLKGAFTAANGLKVFALAGPYVGIGVDAKIKLKTEYSGVITQTQEQTHVVWSNKKVVGGKDFTMKRLDYGLNFGGGFEYKSVILEASYSHGLADLALGGNLSDKEKVYNGAFNISLGYRIVL